MLLGEWKESYARCSPRKLSSIRRQRDIAALWHWRWQMELENPLTDPPGEDSVEEQAIARFGEPFRPLVAEILDGCSDFSLYGQPFPGETLDRAELTRVRADLSKWRYHAFEWILSDRSWEEIGETL